MEDSVYMLLCKSKEGESPVSTEVVVDHTNHRQHQIKNQYNRPYNFYNFRVIAFSVYLLHYYDVLISTYIAVYHSELIEYIIPIACIAHARHIKHILESLY